MGSTGAVHAAPHPHSPIACHVAPSFGSHMPQCVTSGSKPNIVTHGWCSVRTTVVPGADCCSAVSRGPHRDDSGFRDSGARFQRGCGACGGFCSGDNALHASGHRCMSDHIYHDAPDTNGRLTQYLTAYLTSHCEQYCDDHLTDGSLHWCEVDDAKHGTHTCLCIAGYASNAIGSRVTDAATHRTPPHTVRKIFFAIRRVAPLYIACRPVSHVDTSVWVPGRQRIRRDASADIQRAVYRHTARRVYDDSLAIAPHAVLHGAARAAWLSAQDEISRRINGSADGAADTHVYALVRPRMVNAMWRDAARTVSPATVSRVSAQTATNIYSPAALYVA